MLDTAIIGGGIAGLAAALFARQSGKSWPVFEKQSQLSCQDNLLWLAPNGLQMLAELDLLEPVLAVATPQSSMIFSDQYFKTLMQMRGHPLEKSLGHPIIALRRDALYHILKDALLAAGGELHFGHQLSGIEADSSGLSLHFDRKASVRTRYLIGADGIGSLVRRQLYPKSSVHYQGLRTYLGKSQSHLAPKYVGRTIESWGKGLRFVLTSLDGQTVYWSAIERAAIYTANSAPIPQDFPETLARQFQSFHPDVSELLAAADETSIHRCNFGVVTGLSSYLKGRTVLIGDAAHGMPPNMGQGASLGLEDAKHVTQLLLSAESRFLAKEDRPRVRRAHQMRQLANSMNVLFQPRSTWASHLRNRIASLIPDSMNERRMQSLYRTPNFLRAPIQKDSV